MNAEPPNDAARFALLEREVRRLTALAVFLSIGLAVVLVLHFLPAAPVLEAKGLTLRDARGMRRVELGFRDDGSPMLRLNNAEQRARVMLYLRDDGAGELRFSDRGNVHRARIGVAADGTPEVLLAGADGRTVTALRDSAAGQAARSR